MPELCLEKAVLEDIIAHARREYPLESCGYLAGGDGVLRKYYPLRNTDRSERHFSLDPEEQFRAAREIRALGMDVLAVVHSHPHSPAWPSQEDVRLAFDPTVLSGIISLAEVNPVFNLFTIRDGSIKGEPMEVLK